MYLHRRPVRRCVPVLGRSLSGSVRAGSAANRVIEQLRSTAAVRRVVYIACRADHQYTSANLVALGRPGPQSFRLVRASPVDLFPHTDHVELVLTFQR